MSESQLNQEQPEVTTPQVEPPAETTPPIDENWTEIGTALGPIENPNQEVLTPVDAQPETRVDPTSITEETSEQAETPATPQVEAPAVTVLGETIVPSTVDASETQDSNTEVQTIAEVGVAKEAQTQNEHMPPKVGALGALTLLAAGVAARFKHNKKA